MVYREQPPSFHSQFEIVSCFFENDEEILLLHRQDHKSEGNTWGVPAGKVEKGESLEQAMTRELLEETGYSAKRNDLKYYSEVYVRYPTYDFIYHIYHLGISPRPRVELNSREHKAFQWVLPHSALGENLIPDLDTCIKLFYNE